MVRELSSLEDISAGFILNLYGGETGRIGRPCIRGTAPTCRR